MPKRSLAAILLAALVLVLGVVAAGCGGDDDDSGSNGTGSSSSQSDTGKEIKVGLVTDIGGLNDRSFNQLANEGVERAKSELGVDPKVLTSKSDADYVPNLSSLAQQKYDLVIGVGFLMSDAVNTVATKFPDTNFAIIDFSAKELKSKPKNVRGLLFAEQEPGYVVGYIAGLYAKDQGKQVVSSVGGQKIPPVDHYIAGYQAGAKAADSSIKTLNDYSQDFVDQAKCKEIALNHIAEGAQVVFQVAGQCGLGALDAAKEKNLQGIGVDADQGYLGDHIMTSAEKKVDVAVFDTVKAAQDGSFKGGEDQLFNFKNDGVAYGKLNAAGQKYADQAEEVKQKIIDGDISNIPTEVK